MNGLFPYAKTRGGQKDFLADARMVCRSGGVLIAEVPTGVGKTAASLAAAIESALSEDRRVVVACNRTTQHDIVIKTVREIAAVHGGAVGLVDLVGRQNLCADSEARALSGESFQRHCAKAMAAKTCPWAKVLGMKDA